MGNYVSNSLIKGEVVVYEGHYHWSYWLVPLFWMLLLCVGGGVLVAVGFLLGAVPMAVGVSIFGWYYLKYTSDEMVVTNRRLILKTGIISRDTFELQLQKVESVGVDQTIWGRIFGFGVITGTGTGGSKGSVNRVAHPLDFRKAFQEAAAVYDDAWRLTADHYRAKEDDTEDEK